MLAQIALATSLALAPLETPEDALIATAPKGYEMTRMVAVNGRPVERSFPFRFSPNLDRVAYLAKKKHRVYAFLDDDDIAWGDDGLAPVFSGDGEHAAFAVVRYNNDRSHDWRLYVDDDSIAREDWVGPLALSEDGRTIAYWRRPGYREDREGVPVAERYQMIVAHSKKRTYKPVESKIYEWANVSAAPVFVPGSDRHAVGLVRTRQETSVLTAGGRKDELGLAPEGYFHTLVVAPATGRLAIVSRELGGLGIDAGGRSDEPPPPPTSGPAYRLDVDGAPLDVETDAAGLPAFSQNGEHLAFVYHLDGEFGVGVGTKALPTIDDVILRAFPDDSGRRVALVAAEDGELKTEWWLHPSAPTQVKGGARRLLIVDVDAELDADGDLPREVGPTFDSIGAIAFSPDGRHVAYTGHEDGSVYVQCGEKRIGPFQAAGTPVWTDEKTLVVGTREGREFWRRTLVVD